MVKVLKRTTRARRNSKTAMPYKGLTLREIRAVERVRRKLRAILPNGEIKSLVLYGSKVRGESNADSDIDLFLVYDDVTPQQEASLKEFALDYLGGPGCVHLFLYRADKLAQQNGTSALIHNVAHHGILIQGAPVPKLDIDRRHVAEMNLRLAGEELHAAQLLMNNAVYRKAVSSSYYAVLYAADAALATKGIIPHSHEGTHSLFGYHFIRTGEIDAKFKGLVKRAKDARMEADYGRDAVFTRQDAEYWLTRAKEFVAAIESPIPRWLEQE